MASDCADWMKPRARSVYFSIFICLPSAYRSAPGHDPASRGALLRPIAPQSKLARDPARKAAQISADHARRHGFSLGFPLAALTFLNRTVEVCRRSLVRLAADVGRDARKRKRPLHKFVCSDTELQGTELQGC